MYCINQALNIYFLHAYIFIFIQISASTPSNEYIAIKDKWYSVLKQIGSGGSSKVRFKTYVSLIR